MQGPGSFAVAEAGGFEMLLDVTSMMCVLFSADEKLLSAVHTNLAPI